MKRFPIIFLCAIFFFLVVVPSESAFARHRSKVLGASTNPQLPPTTEGPGLLLPDSPFYFLDPIKQKIREFIAITPAAKAKLHSQVASERLAELNFMLAKQNPKGIDIALSGVSESLKKAADEIEKAELTGADVKKLAKEINDSIKNKQVVMDMLENQATGELKAKASVVSQAILESKVKIEDALPEDELEKEIEFDLERSVAKKLHDASETTKEVEDELETLQEEEREAAQKSLKKREEALKKAIAEKNEELKKDHERFLDFEKKKNDDLMKLEAIEAQQVTETVKKAQETASKINKTRQEASQIKTESAR